MEKTNKKKIKKKGNTHLLLAFSHSFSSSSVSLSFIVVIDFVGGRRFLLGDIFFAALSLSSRRTTLDEKNSYKTFSSIFLLTRREMCVSKLASREMAICAVTANVSHSYSLFFIASERHRAKKKQKNFFVLLARERFQLAELVVCSPGKYLHT